MTKSKSKPKPTLTPKLTLSVSRDIPLDKLVLSQSNVRQVKAGVSIEELAEDIARRTLLQSLTVRAVLDENGVETGMFEVPAGGRRFRALQHLVKQKRLAPDAPIPCVIREGGLAEEDSLAENVQRVALHPLDQFRAFKTLREKGRSDDDIAAAFFVTPAVVKQRLKLAAIAPALLDLYADDAMNLEQLMAFTVNPDHQRQVEVWEALKSGYAREPYHIRRLLTEGAVRASDKRARFVGVEAYEAAGGAILRDLFADAEDGWLQDAGLLNRLVAEKLDARAAELRGEGWKWTEAAVDFPYGHAFGLRRLVGERPALSEEDQATYDTLKAEYDALNETHDGADELSEDVDQRLGELETAIEAFEERPLRYLPDDIARAGVFVSISPEGRLRLEPGFVRPEDEPSIAAPAVDDETLVSITAEAETRGEESAAIDDDVDGRVVSDRLVMDLTTFRTVALRDALSLAPDVAHLAVLHALTLAVFYPHARMSALLITCQIGAAGAAQVEGLADFAAVRAFETRHDAWRARLPQDPAELWAYLVELDAEDRAQLFAHCTAASIDAVRRPHIRAPQTLAHADALAEMLGLDLRRAGWTPTASGYFSRITKAQILDAVREGRGDDAAERLAPLTKPEMARAAEDLLRDTAWVPAPLRTASVLKASSADAGDACVAIAAE